MPQINTIWEVPHESKELDAMEMTGNVVIEKDARLEDSVRIQCPKCNAPKGQMCDPGTNRICAERFVKQLAKEAKSLTGDHMFPES